MITASVSPLASHGTSGETGFSKIWKTLNRVNLTENKITGETESRTPFVKSLSDASVPHPGVKFSVSEKKNSVFFRGDLHLCVGENAVVNGTIK